VFALAIVCNFRSYVEMTWREPKSDAQWVLSQINFQTSLVVTELNVGCTSPWNVDFSLLAANYIVMGFLDTINLKMRANVRRLNTRQLWLSLRASNNTGSLSQLTNESVELKNPKTKCLTMRKAEITTSVVANISDCWNSHLSKQAIVVSLGSKWTSFTSGPLVVR